jgi:hypothetical protein
MMVEPASTIKQEVGQLIDRQIETLRQQKSLSDADLSEYHQRSERITKLCQELERIARTTLHERPRKAS